MAEYAVMPLADYEDACDAVREKTGGTDTIKSGELGAQIRGISGGGGSGGGGYSVVVYNFTSGGVEVFADGNYYVDESGGEILLTPTMPFFVRFSASAEIWAENGANVEEIASNYGTYYRVTHSGAGEVYIAS